MQKTAIELATFLNGHVDGDPNVLVVQPCKIEEGVEGGITFLANPKYEPFLYNTKASVAIVEKAFIPKETISVTLIRVDDVYSAIAKLLAEFNPIEVLTDISPLASIDKSAKLGKGVGIGPFVSIKEGVSIGDKCVLHDQVYLGKNVTIGDGTVIYPGVKILANCKIGKHCIIHPNTVIGGDGFGYAPVADGSYQKINHVGNVIVEDNVEIGANTTIDRSTMGSTIIREGVKLDNLVQLGHNTEIGKNTVIAAQTGVAGSTKIGASARIGGQVGFSGHLRIADRTEIQAQSGISHSIEEEGKRFFGSPAIDYNSYIRSYSIFKKLPDLYKTIYRLQKELEAIKKDNETKDN